MLRDGGNAADAAIAAAFADAVLQPASSGIGGGGATIVVADGQRLHYDYREYVGVSGVVPEDGVGVPGFVAGMMQLHDEHGSLPWDDLLTPAIELAEEGVHVTRYLASAIDTPRGEQAIADLAHFHRSDGAPLREGDLLVQAELAQTMRDIAADPTSIYTGELAEHLTQIPGLDRETLSSYEVDVSDPASGQVGEYTMLSGAPPLPGAAIIQMIQIAEAAGIGDIDPDSAEFVDLQTQAWRIADGSVQRFFGDPKYVDVPVDRLTDDELNAELADQLPGAQAVSKSSAAEKSYDGAANTTHISVIDADGLAISMTNTITNYWGSGRYVDGYFLNDQLRRFFDIGVTDANTPQPGRRSVTWSSPSMLLDGQGRPALIVGTPGGRQIPNTTANVVTRWALHGQTLDEAVPAERFILTQGILWLESGRLLDQLIARGYDARVLAPERIPNLGSVQALDVDWDGRVVHSFADKRRSAGFVVGDEAELGLED
ncbi:gamma-glutamyltransferase [Ornithinimicrobium sp. Y1847]|uniref:gamma-glutamyltransferase n=1 Tax=Ornithinimicrobium sp. Y1847 TaxID=3405419 RepID=UPI003B67DC09